MVIPSFFANNALWEHGGGIIILLIFGVFLALSTRWMLLYPLFFIAIFSLYFFRFPHRECVETRHDSTIVVCPADGRIVDIQYDAKGGFDGYAWKIAMFLSPFDVHISWVPTPGVIEGIAYRPGTFHPAFVPKSSSLNERCDVCIRCDEKKQRYIVRQIAGAVARRIVCWVHEGDRVRYGDTYGMIRFGSRVELLLPDSVQIEVGMGQRVYGGSTVIGRWV